MEKKSLFKKLIIIFLVVFIDLLGFGLVIPILPYYARAYGASATTLGALLGVYSLMQFFCAPLWGALSDRWGRKPILLITIFGTAAAHTLLGLAQSLEVLFIGRLMAGLFGANISTAAAYIADVTPEESRAKGMGLIGAGYGLGFMFGPAVGGLLAPYGLGIPALVAAILSLINLIFAMLVLTEPELPQDVRIQNRSRKFSFEGLRKVMTFPGTSRLIFVFFLVTMGFTQLEACFALVMQDRFGLGAKDAGLYLGFMGIIMVLLQGGLIGRLSKVFAERSLALTGLILLILALVLFSGASTLNFCIIAMVLVALGQGLQSPTLMSLVSKSSPPQDRGSVMGLYQSAGSFARMVGPPTAGMLYDHLGNGAPFMGAAFIVLLAFMSLALMPVLRARASSSQPLETSS